MEIQLYKTYAYGPRKNNGANYHIIPEIKALWAEWFGYPTEEEYKSIILQSLEIAKEKSLEYWIADARKLELISESANRWTITEGLFTGAQYGIKRLALILPGDYYLAQFLVEDVDQGLSNQIKTININMQIKYFRNLEDALEWRS
ncbi:MAG: hypothetical protein RML72_04165 [Bacteroidia bacterium]|nr:hypothetical protein [Bacteroidia bacterium]MDW8158058.1 hypothetical protein [Bacteroidia bacterium]